MEILHQYFRAEKAESLFFLAAGVIAIAIAGYAFAGKHETLYRGIAIPLMLVGLIQVVVGGSVYFRTDGQVATLEQQFAADTKAAAAQELPRMETVSRNFMYYRYIETVFVLIGLTLMLLMRSRDFWLGIGMGMLAQGTLMLLLDLFAERRADVYTTWLGTLS